MDKLKTQAGEHDQKDLRPATDETVPTSEKGGGPAGVTQQRTAAELPASTTESPGAARAAGVMADQEAGVVGKARMAGVMQGAVGNTHLGEMLAESAGGQGTPIQRKEKKSEPQKLPAITFPLPQETVRNPSGEAEFRCGEVRVVALPDKKSRKEIVINGKKRDAKTDIGLYWEPPGGQQQGGKVVAVDPLPTPKLTIQTTYGPKGSPEMKSGYGKGTTKEDIAAGKTSLGYHEGSHGEHAIQYTKEHPLPQFKGQAGMSIAEFKKAQAEYDQEMEAYRQELHQYHLRMTDCVGQKEESCEE